jgi:enamine deaminase RidA (YjgF/YER057c/UK114 family)
VALTLVNCRETPELFPLRQHRAKPSRRGNDRGAAQARLAFGNLGRAIAAVGARPEQVCKITVYVVDYKRDEHVPIIEAAKIALFGDHKPANVVVGIATMSPGYLIEVDAIAVIDHTTES